MIHGGTDNENRMFSGLAEGKADNFKNGILKRVPTLVVLPDDVS